MIDSISRRAVLRAGASMVAAGGLAVTSGDLAVRAMAPAGQARTFDIDENGEENQQFVVTDDPAGGPGEVLHATTDGVATTDYAVTMANLSRDDLTLAGLDARGLEYDYYVGSSETGMSPDEVVIVVHTDDEGRKLVFRTEDGTRVRGGETWRTRDVTPELTGTSSLPGIDQHWKAFHPDGRQVERIGRNLVARFGGDATVKGVGVGKGTPTTGEAVSDTYYDRFTVAGTEYDLPTTVRPGRGTGSDDGNG